MTSLMQFTHFNPESLGEGGVRLWWLGQAGFLIEMDGLRIVIDAYLSDSLAQKYAGKKFPHIRMTQAPVAPKDLTNLDWILCTHAHTDHMDPGTLPGLLSANPEAKVIVPKSASEVARDRGIPVDRMELVDAGLSVQLGNGVTLTASPAAHEERALDDSGAHLFLGYVLSGLTTTIWHSGDTVPFDGLVEALAGVDIDLALLPVNGRDAMRASNGVPGNLTLAEALNLSEQLGVRAMIGHHLDLFEFNTLDRDEGTILLRLCAPKFDATLAELNTVYSFSAAKKIT